jgi:hypothetical protein
VEPSPSAFKKIDAQGLAEFTEFYNPLTAYIFGVGIEGFSER